MKIGELAKHLGLNSSRIRFYEQIGLLPPAERGANGYRAYTKRDVKILAFIERAQRLGFSLREVRSFLERPHAERVEQELLPTLHAKLHQIDSHLREVKARRREIVRLIQEIGAGSTTSRVD